MFFNIDRGYKLFFILLIIWIIYDLKTSLQQFKHSCSMTSMWRYPQLYSLYENKDLRYNFYLYGEGQYFYELSQSQNFNGIPIIFVPGNAADAAMVRSIGSILQNKTERLQSPFRFNVFSAHFNEEFSIFDTTILKRQAKFLINSIIELEKLYKNKRNKKYVLLGHSMGGIVIKMALKNSEWLRKNTAFILVMGTMLKDHPIKITNDFINIYHQISSLKDIPVISMHGGFMDELIEESLTKDNNSLTVGYQGIDRVWSMADHKCLVWCNEAQRSISRLLFEYATTSEKNIPLTKFNSLFQRIFNSSTFDYKIIKQQELDDSYEQINKGLLNKNGYIFAIGKINFNLPLLYKHKNKNDINLYPIKTYFYSRQMEYIYSLETIETNENYYKNKNTKIKGDNQQAISMNNKLLFNFFDKNTKSDGTLFVISNSKTFFTNSSIVEYELNYKIDFSLTILRAIKINISNIPFLLSFMVILFSYDTNLLFKILSIQILFYTVTSSIISTTILFLIGIVIIYCLTNLGETLVTVSEILNINDIIIKIYRWMYEKVSYNLLITLCSLLSLFFQPLYLVYSLISLLLSPNILIFFISFILYLPTYLIFYQLPDFTFSFKGNRLYEWSAIIQLVFMYFSRKKKINISPWIFLLPYWLLITFNNSIFTVWEYIMIVQATSISLMFLKIKIIKLKNS
ncbi:GPI inositol-deacylase [Strongyloides ratti]|uniref:GPI inositol-deacylase n=1 Tax=Strongyloides ratti TaxID=34506 RepID=A0A090LG38_STRRB|nr:GPI inositol-deacylase [Strongyloides ratti]CEF67108.1 GPI inositol-deacylase [Strongyloides ratti]